MEIKVWGTNKLDKKIAMGPEKQITFLFLVFSLSSFSLEKAVELSSPALELKIAYRNLKVKLKPDLFSPSSSG